jgi:hypothetical protein
VEARDHAERILPEFQQVQVGDIFPMAPKAKDMFVVRMIEPERALVIGDAAGGMSWAFVLEPVDEQTTGLITRVRATYSTTARRSGCSSTSSGTRRTSRCSASSYSTSSDSWRRQDDSPWAANLRG